jgi:hypothetical protein
VSIRAAAFVEVVSGAQGAAGEGDLTMPHYLLSVWHDTSYDDFEDIDFSAPEIQRTQAQVGAVNESMQREGVWVFAGGLRPPSTATVVRAEGTDVSMTDGPYAESKEAMGGFWVIDVADLDAALDWAGKATVACERPVEVRRLDNA